MVAAFGQNSFNQQFGFPTFGAPAPQEPAGFGVLALQDAAQPAPAQNETDDFFSGLGAFTGNLLKESTVSLARAGTKKVIESEILGKQPIQRSADSAKTSNLNQDTGAIISQSKLPITRTSDLDVIDGPTPIQPNQKRIDQSGLGNLTAALTNPITLGVVAGLAALFFLRRKRK